jgi:hypothetical protein
MENRKMTGANEAEIKKLESDLKEISDYSDQLTKLLSEISTEVLNFSGNEISYSEQRVDILKMAVDRLIPITTDFFSKLKRKDAVKLGELIYRSLRACIRFKSASKEYANKELDHSTRQGVKRRILSEFHIIESLSSELIAFIDLSHISDNDQSRLASVIRDARMAQELFTNLVEQLDSVRSKAIQDIADAKDSALDNASKIKELVSKSSNAYLAVDFHERKKSNSFELSFWFVIMMALLTFDAWLIWKFDLSSVQLWQNRLIDLGLIGFIASVAYWMGKNFRAAMHQRSILNQRIASLKTFQAFYEKVEDKDLKDAIVLEASKTIFSHMSSGYSSDSANMNGPSTADLLKFVSLTKPGN